MRALVQRVSEASVEIGGEVVGAIDAGLVALVGVTHDDAEADALAVARKLAGLRVFADEDGAMNRSVLEVGGGVLVVSQFTLYGDARKGRRPSFTAAADPDRAEPLVSLVVEGLEGEGVRVATGRFGEHMQVKLVNDGPVTLMVETRGGRLV
jgi:D-aminoacyl-tRNA deacylase